MLSFTVAFALLTTKKRLPPYFFSLPEGAVICVTDYSLSDMYKMESQSIFDLNFPSG